MRNLTIATLGTVPILIALAIVRLDPWSERQSLDPESVSAESDVVEQPFSTGEPGPQTAFPPNTPAAVAESIPVDPGPSGEADSDDTLEEAEASREQGPIVRRNPELDRRLDSEAVDPIWAPMVESLFDNMIPLAGLSYSRFETKCAKTICRSVIVHDFGYPAAQDLDDDAEPPHYAGRYQAALLPLVEQGILQGASVQTGASPDSDYGNLESVIYLFRAEDQ